MFLYENCKGLGLYVHIPFCKKICKFCPYCKELYFEEKIDKYIDSVVKEIKLVTRNQREKKKVTSLYFGGGSPALAGYGIKKIIDELDKHFIIKEGIGIELHPDNINIKRWSCSRCALCRHFRFSRCDLLVERHAGQAIVALGDHADELPVSRTVLGDRHGRMTQFIVQGDHFAQRHVGGKVRVARNEAGLVAEAAARLHDMIAPLDRPV